MPRDSLVARRDRSEVDASWPTRRPALALSYPTDADPSHVLRATTTASPGSKYRRRSSPRAKSRASLDRACHHAAQHAMVGAKPGGFSEVAHVVDFDVERDIALAPCTRRRSGRTTSETGVLSVRDSAQLAPVEHDVGHVAGCD